MAMGLSQDFLADVALHYRQRRDLLFSILQNAGFQPFRPQGAYYIMAGIDGFGFDNDQAFARHLVENIGVAGVPGSSFHEDPKDGAGLIRFCFCKKDETLAEADRRLLKLVPAGATLH